MNRIFIALIGILLALTSAQGQNNFWERIKDPYGGACTLSRTPGDTLYATALYNYFRTYRSTDGGDTWTFVYTTGAFQFFIGHAGNFYKKASGKWQRSINEGVDWAPMPDSTQVLSAFVETADGNLSAFKQGKFVLSQDGGATWTESSDLPTIDSLSIHEMYIDPYGGVIALVKNPVQPVDQPDNALNQICYRSTDQGQSWQRLEFPVIPFSRPFFAASGTIFVITDAYESFRLTGTDYAQIQTNLYVQPEQMLSMPNGRLVGFGGAHPIYSDDDGISWQEMTSSFIASRWMPAGIAALPDGSVFAHSDQAVFRTSDNGDSWQMAATGIREAFNLRIGTYTDSIIYVSNSAGFWQTTDLGEHWTRLSSKETDEIISGFGITSSGDVFFTENYKLRRAVGGANPPVDVNPANAPPIIDVFVNPWNDHIFCVTEEGLFRSADLGQNWSVNSIGRYLPVLDFHPSGRLFAIEHYGNCMFSDNEGITWDTLSLPGITHCPDVKVAENGDIYALGLHATNGTMSAFKSGDGGNTWMPVSGNWPAFPLGSHYVWDIANNGHLIYSLSVGHNLSTNEGLNWQNMPEIPSVFVPFPNLSGVHLSASQRLYSLDYNGLNRTVNPVTQGAYISGHARLDADADCSTPDAQQGLRNWIVQADGPFDYYTQTDPDGQYTFFVDTGAYAVSLTPINDIWWSVCDSAQTVVLNSLFAADTADFAALSTADCPLITVDLALPALRRCFDNSAFVQYCNQGSEIADSAWVDVELDPYLSLVSSNQPHIDLGNNAYRFFLGDVASGDCDQFSFVVNVDCDSTMLGQTHCINAHGFPDTLCTSVPDWSGAEINAEVECADSIVHLKLHNVGNAPSQALDYIIIEDDVVLMNGNSQYAPGETITLDRPANGHTWRIESVQEPGHPFSVRAVAFAEGCGGFESLGFINRFEVNSFQPSYDVVCRENVGAYDPNDKQGFPIGAGPEHRIRPGQDIEYLIRFQNTGTDTAFNVVIVDSLSQWLDPASLRTGAASHPYTWQLDGQGVIKFTFANILLPDSNTNLAASQGFVSFRISQRADIPLNTQIFNEAGIYFDFNQPVITNRTLHTVGFDESVATGEAGAGKSESLIIVAPNPVRESAVFSRSTGTFDRHHIEISDAGGRVVHSAGISGKQYLFQRKNLPEGVYFFRISDKSGNQEGTGVLLLGSR